MSITRKAAKIWKKENKKKIKLKKLGEENEISLIK